MIVFWSDFKNQQTTPTLQVSITHANELFSPVEDS